MAVIKMVAPSHVEKNTEEIKTKKTSANNKMSEEEVNMRRENAEIHANDLRREVNRLEKSMGIDLGDDDDIDLDKRYAKVKKLLGSFITIITVYACDLDKDKFVEVKKKKRKVKKFVKVNHVLKSGLFEQECTSFRSDVFRKRYWSLLMAYIFQYTDEIVAGQILLQNDKLSIDEKKVLYIGKLFITVLDFTNAFFKHLNYQESLFKLYVMLTCKNTKRLKQMEDEWATIAAKQIRENMTSLFISDGITKTEMIRFAYLLATNNYKVATANVCDDLESPAESRASRDIIEALGMVATDDWTRNGRPLFVDIFMRSCPTRRYKFKDINTNMNLNYGCKLISMSDFMMNDKTIHQFVNRMTRVPFGRWLFGPLYFD